MSSPTTPDRRPEDAPGAAPAAGPEQQPGTPPAPGSPAAPGSHAAPRPYPPVTGGPVAGPPTSPLPGVAATPGAAARAAVPPSQIPPAAPGAVLPDGRPIAGWTPVGAPGTAPVDAGGQAQPLRPGEPDTTAGQPQRRADRHERLELPEPPPKPGVLRHVLGVLLGLLLTPVGLGLAGVGTARLLEIVGTDDPVSDPAALVMLGSGVGLLVVVVLLAIWSPAVPITGGLLALTVGAAYLAAPGPVDEVVRSLTDGRVLTEPVDQLTAAATSGQLLVAGALVLAAGIAAAVARRKGRRFGQLSAVVEQARTEAAQAEAARQAAHAEGGAPGHAAG